MAGDARQPGYQFTRQDHGRIQPKRFAKIRQCGFLAEDAEDLVQETFFLAQSGLNQGRFQGQSDLDTWIVGIAKNRCLKKRKAQGTQKRSGSELPLDQFPGDDQQAPIQLSGDQAGPEKLASDRQQLDLAQQLVGDLPGKFRHQLLLAVGGRSYQQIASILQISTGLVTSRIQQARSKLRQAIARPLRGSPR
jgi:RNA polymerase sigma-70 factor (ECF subfamily)